MWCALSLWKYSNPLIYILLGFKVSVVLSHTMDVTFEYYVEIPFLVLCNLFYRFKLYVLSGGMVEHWKKYMLLLLQNLLFPLFLWNSLFFAGVLCMLFIFVLFPLLIYYVCNTCDFSHQPLVWDYWSWGGSLHGVQSQCYQTLTHKQAYWRTQTLVFNMSVLPLPPEEGRCEE